MEEYVAEYSYSEGSERTPLSTADQEDWNPPDNDQGNPPKKTIVRLAQRMEGKGILRTYLSVFSLRESHC